MEGYKTIKNKIREAALTISTAFTWSNTPQGRDYWAGVQRNLMDLSNERCDKCGQVIEIEREKEVFRASNL